MAVDVVLLVRGMQGLALTHCAGGEARRTIAAGSTAAMPPSSATAPAT